MYRERERERETDNVNTSKLMQKVANAQRLIRGWQTRSSMERPAARAAYIVSIL